MALSYKCQLRVLKANIKIPLSDLSVTKWIRRIPEWGGPRQQLFNFLLRSKRRDGVVILSQELIASYIGRKVTMLKVYLDEFETLGIIKRFSRRETKQTTIIDITDDFFQDHMKPVLSVLFRCLMFGSLMQISAAPAFEIKTLKPAPDQDRLLLNSLCLKKSNSINQSIVSLTSCIDEYQQRIDRLKLELNRLKQIERESMQANPIPQYIKDVTDLLQLTKWGQIWLIAYPEGAIEYAKMAMRGAHGLKSKYRFFSSKCNEYCKQNEIAPDWTKVNFLKQTFNMPDNAPMTLEIEKQHSPVSGTPKTGSATPPNKEYEAPVGPTPYQLKVQAESKRKNAEWLAKKGLTSAKDIWDKWHAPQLSTAPLETMLDFVEQGRDMSSPIAQEQLANNPNWQRYLMEQAEQKETKAQVPIAPPEPITEDENTIGDDQWFDGTPINYDWMDDTIDEQY